MAFHDPPKTLFFVHLPKTGGLTVNNHIYRYLNNGAAYPASSGAPDDEFWDISRLRDRIKNAGEKPLRFITGHFPFFLAREAGPFAVSATVLRDPVERTISQLRMIEAEHEEFRGKSLEEIYDTPFYFALLLDNLQTRLMSATAEDDMSVFHDHIAIDAGRLERAKHNLEQVGLLGVQPHLDAFIRQIEAFFGWPPRPAEEINARGGSAHASRALRQRIAEDCRFDVELYAHALECVESRKRAATQPR